jgi:hypothetical protein
MVVVADMEHLIACLAILRMANACGSVAHLMEVGKFLGIEVQQVTWSFMLVAIGRFFLLKG